MSEGNQKIHAFQTSVSKEVEDEINALIHRAEQESEAMINAVKDESLNFSFYKISAETKAIKAACKKRVSKQSFQSRRNILQRRSELVDEFFSTIEKEISAFAASEKYSEFIAQQLKSIEAELPFYDGVKIYVKPDDAKNTKVFGKYAELLEASKQIKLGGIAVYYPKEKVYYDRTLDKKLRNERESFINHKEIQL